MLHELSIIVAVLTGWSLLLWVVLLIWKVEAEELVERTKLWWGMVTVFSLSVFIHPLISVISLAVLSFFSLKEFYGMKDARKNERKLFFWCYLSIPLQFYWIYDAWYGMFIVFIPVYVFLFLPLIRIVAGGSKGFLKSVSSTHWGLMLMVFGLSHLAYYPKLDPVWGTKMVMYVVVLTQLNDTVHYLASKVLGKKKLAPSANPNLTMTGAAAGLVAVMLVSWFIAPHLTPLTSVQSLAASVIIGVSGFVGSLNMAHLKRDLLDESKVPRVYRKESVLLKIDSLTYTAPLFLHYVRYVCDLF